MYKYKSFSEELTEERLSSEELTEERLWLHVSFPFHYFLCHLSPLTSSFYSTICLFIHLSSLCFLFCTLAPRLLRQRR